MSLTAAQLNFRRGVIAASDAVVIAGCETPWKQRTTFDVWKDKLGLSQPADETASQSAGHYAEIMLAGWLADELGHHHWVRHPHKALKCAVGDTIAANEWAAATPDRVVCDRITNHPHRLVECKRSSMPWRGTVPEYVWVQVQWQLYVVRHQERLINEAYVLADVMGDAFARYSVAYDEEFTEGVLAPRCKRFWYKVQRDRTLRAPIPPDVDDTDPAMVSRWLDARWPDANGEERQPCEDMEGAVAQYILARERIEHWKEIKTSASNQIKELMGDASKCKADAGTVSWTNRKGAPRWKAIAQAMDAPQDVIDDNTGRGARTLSVRARK